MASTATLGSRTLGGWEATGDTGTEARKRFGTGDEPTRDVSFSTGVGSYQVDRIYRKVFSLAAGANFTIDLTGGGGELDVLNNALSLAKVRVVDLILTTTPAAGVSVRIGPQSVTNGWIGPFQDVDGFQSVRRRFFQDNPVEGWAVSGSSKMLRVHNPGSGTVTGVLEIFGTSS